jgi:hypothetical protein
MIPQGSALAVHPAREGAMEEGDGLRIWRPAVRSRPGAPIKPRGSDQHSFANPAHVCGIYVVTATSTPGQSSCEPLSEGRTRLHRPRMGCLHDEVHTSRVRVGAEGDRSRRPGNSGRLKDPGAPRKWPCATKNRVPNRARHGQRHARDSSHDQGPCRPRASGARVRPDGVEDPASAVRDTAGDGGGTRIRRRSDMRKKATKRAGRKKATKRGKGGGGGSVKPTKPRKMPPAGV